jgi:D-aspartate ligase
MDYSNQKIMDYLPSIVLGTHTMGYGVIRALGIMNIPIIAVYYEKADMGYLSKYVKHKIKTVAPQEKEEEFINCLLDLGRNFGRGLLIPTNDETLVAVSKNLDTLENQFIVAVPDYNTTLKFISKEITYKIAENIGIPFPKTFEPANVKDLEKVCNIFDFPLILKPKQSHLYFSTFSKKMMLINNFNELKNEFTKAKDFNLDCIIQEFIPGNEEEDEMGINFNSYIYPDSSVIKFAAKKIRYSEGGLGIPTMAQSCDDIPEVTEQSIKLLRAINFTGYSCIEYKKDYRDGKYKLMEMNGRHNRSTMLAVFSGINFPWIQYSDLVLNKKYEQLNYKSGLYWIDFFKDIEGLPSKMIKKHGSIKAFLRPYFKSKIFADITITDLFPTLKRFYYILFLLVRRLKDKFFKFN